MRISPRCALSFSSARANAKRAPQNKDELLMGGKKLGVFVDDWRRGNPDLEQASDRLLRSAPSNDLIPPSYESMILERHPEERARQRQLERERERKLEKERERVREIQRQKEKQEERERKAELARRAMAELEASAAKAKDAAAQPVAVTGPRRWGTDAGLCGRCCSAL